MSTISFWQKFDISNLIHTYITETKKTSKKEAKKDGKADKKRGPDKKLKPNLKIKVIEKDPLFETK